MPDGGLIDIGGLAGHAYSQISNCYATGDVYAVENSISIGGLIGFAGNAVSNCYASGQITTNSSMVGGIVGFSFAPISYCTANNPSIEGITGNLNGLHRIAGNVDIDGKVISSFALASMRINSQSLPGEGDENSLDGLSKPLSSLQSEDLYKNQLGWDFENIWVIREGQGYPYFAWKEYHTNIVSASVNNEDFGSISPIGDIAFEKGSDAFFAITPQEGYSIHKVLIDGEDIGQQQGYTFSDITANHTIEVVFIEGDLGLGDNEGSKGLVAYPNPVNDILTVEIPEISSANAELYSISGQKLISQDLEVSKQIDMRRVARGVYILNVTSPVGTQSLRIIKE